jgi:hypothetical protein
MSRLGFLLPCSPKSLHDEARAVTEQNESDPSRGTSQFARFG